MAFGVEPGPIPQRRWHTIFRTAVWCLWKAYLTHSFAAPTQLWALNTTRSIFRDMLRDRILTERILSTKELYSNNIYNVQMFTTLWGEDPRAIRIIRGPTCLSH
jgi:hypothetical protein